MTAKIHLLPPEQAQKIAAGEVIERPANIVKELVENSIDAGATTLTLTFEKAGKNLIKISDNGCGMNDTDAQACFLRHATSKLSHVDDLESLDTFGFRGEALASIAAVGVVTLTTQEAHAEIGTRIVYTHGVRTEHTRGSFSPGTTLSISNLFDAIPVRKTFLKQDETEWNQIMQVLYALALTHENLGFKIIRDGSQVLQAPPVTNRRDRISQLWSHTLTGQLTPVLKKEGPISLTGFISHPTYQRYGKDQMYCFVNERFVKNHDLTKAVLRGYKHALVPGKYPACFLWIELDKRQVDVNIHPRKEEVRFTKPGVVASAIETAVAHALQSILPQKTTAYMPYEPAPLPSMPPTPNVEWSPLAAFLTTTPEQAPAHIQQHITPPPQRHDATTPETAPFTVIGQLFATYIIIEQGNRLVLIDQHAAHERILYNEMTHRFENKEGTQLLFPEVVDLQSEATVSALLPFAELFATQGIGFHQCGPHHIALTSAPPKLQKESLSHVVRDAADYITAHATLSPEQLRKALNEHVNSHLACKTAVRAGDVLEKEAMYALVTKLMETHDRFMCIHGRPTHWIIEKDELERKFRRS